jgi:hypothetical protein
MKFKLFIIIIVLIFITSCENKGKYIDVGPVLVDENLLPKNK